MLDVHANNDRIRYARMRNRHLEIHGQLQLEGPYLGAIYTEAWEALHVMRTYIA